MTPLTHATADLTSVLGWTLIHFVWQGTAIAALLALWLLAVPRSAARVRYVSGVLALALMLGAPAVTAWQLTSAPHHSGNAGAFGSVAQQFLADRLLPASGEQAAWPSSRQVSPDGAVRPGVPHLLPWIVTVWAIGVVCCSIRLAGGWWQARRLVRLGVRPAPERWQRAKDAIAQRLRLARGVRLLESARVQVPVVVGWLQPVLLVPPAVLAGLPPAQLEAVIAHELAHVRRHDYLVNLLQAAVETLLFYHPGVWWVSRTVRVEREHCCDDLAVAACGDAVLYARALTAVEALRYGSGAQVAMAVTGSPLPARVRRLLGIRQPATAGSSGWAVAALTALMVSGAGATSGLRDLPIVGGSAGAGAPEGATLAAAVLAGPLALAAQSPAPPPDGERPVAREQDIAPREERGTASQQGEETGPIDAERQDRERAMAAARAARRKAEASIREAVQKHREALRAAEIMARRDVRDAEAAVRQALEQHREAIRAAEHEALREVRASVREARREREKALKAARQAARRMKPEIEREMEQLGREMSALSEEIGRNAAALAAELSREVGQVASELAVELSREAGVKAAQLAAEIAREVAVEVERALREADGLPGRESTDQPPPAPPAPPAPASPPVEPSAPPPPADAPLPPPPPQVSGERSMPALPPAEVAAPLPPAPADVLEAPVAAPVPPAPPAPAVAPAAPVPPVPDPR